MANLKDLKLRIRSVQSTKKITSAMKMIAAAKLKKAQSAAESSRPYAEHMGHVMSDLVSNQTTTDGAPKLLVGTGQDKTHLLVILTSNRGLCGGFNSSLVRHAKRHIKDLRNDGKKIKVIIIGKKGLDILRQDASIEIIGEHLSITNPRFFNAEAVSNDIVDRFEKGEFDMCSVFYNKFISALSQDPTRQQLIPFQASGEVKTEKLTGASIHEYEPSEEVVLERLLPKNIKVQIFSALLESTASEHGARMAAMDGATRNAEDLIGDLNLTYNRTRQAVITSELIEIISGADAL